MRRRSFRSRNNRAITTAPRFPRTRKDVKPLDIVQKEGASFSVEGWQVRWQNLSFRVGWTAREGLVLHQIAFRDGGQERPIIYRASVTDMIVPYADPTANHFWKSAFDAGEYGLGKLANALELGCDCLGHIHYFDVAGGRRLRQAGRDEERDLPARRGFRHPLEAL